MQARAGASSGLGRRINGNCRRLWGSDEAALLSDGLMPQGDGEEVSCIKSQNRDKQASGCLTTRLRNGGVKRVGTKPEKSVLTLILRRFAGWAKP
jgi:hypothetical protein